MPKPPPSDKASVALRHQRRDIKRVGLRYVAEQSRALAKQDPTRYSYVSHGTISRMERSKGAWFRTNFDMGMIQSLIQILWNGDHHAFAHDTGLQLIFPHQTQPEADPPAPAVILPHYLEGERPSLYQRRRRLHQAPDHHADFLYQHHSHDLEPTIPAHQLLACQHATTVPAGHLAVLQRATGLTLAWSAGNDTYLTERNPDPTPLNENESVYGIVVAIQPHRPDLTPAHAIPSPGSGLGEGPRQDLTTLIAQRTPRQKEPSKPLTISCPRAFQDELRAEARRLQIPLQTYLETALEGFLDHYQPNLMDLPDPITRSQPHDPNFTARIPTSLLTRLKQFTKQVHQIETRSDSPTKAAIVLLAYRQTLEATRETPTPEPSTG